MAQVRAPVMGLAMEPVQGRALVLEQAPVPGSLA
jgi:hypothetical protein